MYIYYMYMYMYEHTYVYVYTWDASLFGYVGVHLRTLLIWKYMYVAKAFFLNFLK